MILSESLLKPNLLLFWLLGSDPVSPVWATLWFFCWGMYVLRRRWKDATNQGMKLRFSQRQRTRIWQLLIFWQCLADWGTMIHMACPETTPTGQSLDICGDLKGIDGSWHESSTLPSDMLGGILALLLTLPNSLRSSQGLFLDTTTQPLGCVVDLQLDAWGIGWIFNSIAIHRFAQV